MNENIRLEWFKPDLTAPLEVPLMDSGVHAGFPSPADDSIEQPLDLNKLVAPNPNATFFARVVGDSMKDAHIEEGDLLAVSPGTVFEFLYISSDLDLAMLAFSNSLMENWQKEDLLQTYLQGRLFLHLSLTVKEVQRMEQLFALLWEVVHDRPFPRASVQSLISLCFHQLDFVRKSSQSTERQQHTRQEEVFNRFLELVNKYAARERSITFYADRLFLTPRYLSTLVRQASGRTVMDWVNEAVMQEAKLMLRHTDKLVYQIADELNFPNASFFSKYFRRMAGMTPNDYRRKDE